MESMATLGCGTNKGKLFVYLPSDDTTRDNRLCGAANSAPL